MCIGELTSILERCNDSKKVTVTLFNTQKFVVDFLRNKSDFIGWSLWEITRRTTKEEVPLIDAYVSSSLEDRWGVKESIEQFVSFEKTSTDVCEKTFSNIFN